jgi:hypothetical protein
MAWWPSRSGAAPGTIWWPWRSSMRATSPRQRRHRRGVEHQVETSARHGERTARVAVPVVTRQAHAPAGGADHHHVVHPRGPRDLDVEIAQQADPPGPDEITARLVAGKGRLVDQGDACRATGENEGGDAARRTRPDNEDVEAITAHGSALVADLLYVRTREGVRHEGAF